MEAEKSTGKNGNFRKMLLDNPANKKLGPKAVLATLRLSDRCTALSTHPRLRNVAGDFQC